MKKYGVTVNQKTGNKVYYAGVTANSHKEAKEKVRKDRVAKGEGEDIKSIVSEIITDWNEVKDVLSHWNAEEL